MGYGGMTVSVTLVYGDTLTEGLWGMEGGLSVLLWCTGIL